MRKNIGINLDYSIEWALARLFEKELSCIRLLENQKLALNNNADFEPFAAFDLISKSNPDCIDCDSLLAFFQSHKYFLSDEDALHVFRRLDQD